jgi:ribulose-phosphate 3-epimerase
MGANALLELVRDGPLLSVGVLTADLGHLADEMALLEAGGARLAHIDVMDGVFCPMMTVGPPFVNALGTSLLKDVHLMIHDPLGKVEWFVAAGADMVTFHLEGAAQPHRVLHLLGRATNAAHPEGGIVRGVGLNPSTPVEALEPLLDEVDYVLVLAIDPGWGGQRFQEGTARRLERVRELIARSGRPIALGVDGGVTRENITAVAALGADVVVSGSAIFDGRDATANLRLMQAGLQGGTRT